MGWLSSLWSARNRARRREAVPVRHHDVRASTEVSGSGDRRDAMADTGELGGVSVSGEADRVSAKYPHCDSRILHAPGECQYCDHYPKEQQKRIALHINFTGHNIPGNEPCPADKARGPSTWGGNLAQPVLCRYCGQPKQAHGANEVCLFSPGSTYKARTPEDNRRVTDEFFKSIIADLKKEND
jgi:hypothetical protein